jgi:uncharacterized iron-regulated membrane protein
MEKFQKTSWQWQLEQIQQRLGEWIMAKLRFGSPKQVLPEWLITAISYFLWFLLFAGLAWIAYLIVNRYGKQFGLRNRRPSAPKQQPVKQYTLAELLSQAQHFQSQKNYGEACRYLYLAMLQRLNDANLVPHQTSRTDREYAKILTHLPGMAPVTNQGKLLLQTHEQLQFADRTITAEGFDSCQQAYSQIVSQLEQQVGQNP